jgi:DNA-binding sugar fermentation-stimulating protein
LFNAICNDQEVVVHTPGLKLGGYVSPGRPLLIKPENGSRHSSHSLVAILDQDRWVGGNPTLANEIARSILKQDLIDDFLPTISMTRETKLGMHRYDFCVNNWAIEVKSSSFCVDGTALFPVQELVDLEKQKVYKQPTSTRFVSQLQELSQLNPPLRGCVLVVVQRSDCTQFTINPLDPCTKTAASAAQCAKIAVAVDWDVAGRCTFAKRLKWVSPGADLARMC